MNYHFKIHKEGDGFWAQCLEFPGCFTEADTREELELNMREALRLCVEGEAAIAPPDPSIKTSRSIVEIPLLF